MTGNESEAQGGEDEGREVRDSSDNSESSEGGKKMKI